MTIKSVSKEEIGNDKLDPAFYATGNALISTQAEDNYKNKPEIFLNDEDLEVVKIMSKTTKVT